MQSWIVSLVNRRTSSIFTSAQVSYMSLSSVSTRGKQNIWKGFQTILLSQLCTLEVAHVDSVWYGSFLIFLINSRQLGFITCLLLYNSFSVNNLLTFERKKINILYWNVSSVSFLWSFTHTRDSMSDYLSEICHLFAPTVSMFTCTLIFHCYSKYDHIHHLI